MIEVKEVQLREIKKILDKVGFTLSNTRLKRWQGNYKEDIGEFELFLLLESRKFPTVIINPYTEESFYNPKKNYINIGIPLAFSKECHITTKAFARLLLYHELSHENHTQVDVEKLPYPFILLNILEDERIERLAKKKWMSAEQTFSDLHYISFNAYYEKGNTQEVCERVFNPYNYIIVSRWSRWNRYVKMRREKLKKVDKWSEIHEKLGKRKYEYFKDVEKVLDDATKAETTEALVENTIWFYEKWKELLQESNIEQIIAGIGHGQPDIPDGTLDPEEKISKEALDWIEKELEEARKSDEEADKDWEVREEDNDIIKSSSRFWEKEEWEVDKSVVERLKSNIKKIRWKSRKTETQKSMLGRKPDARRVENLLPNPMRRKKEIEKENTPKVLFVIDGSGSMNGFPYVNAVHLAFAFKEVLGKNVDIVVTTPEEEIKITNLKDLLRFKCNGGTENLRSVEKYIKDYDLVIFFTDACITREDENFLQSIYSNKVIGILTTMDKDKAQDWLPKFFKKVAISDNIEGLTKELAFLLKRGR